jgi:hypothetical protein
MTSLPESSEAASGTVPEAILRSKDRPSRAEGVQVRQDDHAGN